MPESEKYEFENLIGKLEKIKGRHTELISVYIPANFNINSVAKQIESEKSTASNIKSKVTRKAVLNALERITRYLKSIKKLPEKGLVIFCGNISEKEGQENIQLWYIEPLQPLKIRLYRCDQTFVIEPLKEMLEATEIYGLVVLDRREATLGILEGKQIKTIRKLTSGVPGKIRAGGQSSQRFHRITEGMAKEFYRRVAEAMKEAFFNLPKLKGILIGGPIPTKEDFLKEGNLATSLKNIIIGVKDLGYADEHGLELLVKESQDILNQQEIIKEKKLIENFFEMLGKSPEKVAYNLENVEKALKAGAVKTLIISKKLNIKIIEKFRRLADNIAADTEIVSTETSEGMQFWSLGGIGAILRFSI